MTAKPRNIVCDTSTAVSAMLMERSTPALAFRRMLEYDQPHLSQPMRAELLDVFSRDKFDRYTSPDARNQFLARYFELALPIEPRVQVSDCVDVKDNMILECALEGKARLILSSDDHLLRLHRWRGIPILKPGDYLALQPGEDLL